MLVLITYDVNTETAAGKGRLRNSGWKEEIAPSGKTVCKLWKTRSEFGI